jgi:DNA replication protein DnaC
VAKKDTTKEDILSKYKLSKIDTEIISYKLQFPQITHLELSKICNCNRSHVTTRLNSEIVQKALSEFDIDWKANIIKAKNKAARKLVKHIDNPNPAISIRACEQILQLDKANISELDGEQGGIKFEGWDD